MEVGMWDDRIRGLREKTKTWIQMAIKKIKNKKDMNLDGFKIKELIKERNFLFKISK